MTTRDFLFLMVVFPLTIILGIVAFVGLQEMAMLELNQSRRRFPPIAATRLTALRRKAQSEFGPALTGSVATAQPLSFFFGSGLLDVLIGSWF